MTPKEQAIERALTEAGWRVRWSGPSSERWIWASTSAAASDGLICGLSVGLCSLEGRWKVTHLAAVGLPALDCLPWRLEQLRQAINDAEQAEP